MFQTHIIVRTNTSGSSYVRFLYRNSYIFVYHNGHWWKVEADGTSWWPNGLGREDLVLETPLPLLFGALEERTT